MNFRFTLSIFAFFFVSSFASAQNKLNGDSLFTQAREKAFAGNHAEAIPLLDTVLTHFPNYADVKIFKARILSWDKNYTEADTLLQQVLRDKPDNIDAHKAITDNAMSSKNYKGAVTYAEQGILVDPNNIDLLLKKAKALIELKDYKNAESSINTILQIDSANQEAAKLKKEIEVLKRKNTVALYNLHDWFGSIYKPRNLFSLEYKRALSVGPIVARINYANRFSQTGWQYETDFYPRFSKTISGYFNYGYSASSLFPHHRIGAEVYKSFPNKWSATLGFRYLAFSTLHLYTITASGSKYFGNYWMGLRVYITPTNKRTAESLVLYLKRFLQNENNYLLLTLGQGVSPDNSTYSGGFQNLYLLNTQNAKLLLVKNFASRYGFQIGMDVTRLQVPFDLNKHIFQFTLDTGIKYQF